MRVETCFGIDPASGRTSCVRYAATVEEALAAPDASPGPERAFLSAGWIDLQVNGYAGVDYNSPRTPIEDIGRSIPEIHKSGVTRFFPTIITGPPEEMCGALRNLAAAKERLREGRSMEGFHVEGPHISAEDGPRGAHPVHCVRPPDLEEFRRWQDAARGNVRIVTLAPEWPEAPKYIEAIVKEGVIASIGHTAANSEQIRAAVSAGATMSTHLGNGAHFLMPRHPNCIWDQLAEDRLAAGLIADGVHLPGSFLRAAIRAKGVSRAFVVTDAVMPAGCLPGRYRVGTVDVDLLPPGDRVVVAGTHRLAGSALHMYRAVEILVRLAGLDVGEAVTMATLTPARAAHVQGREDGLARGQRADITRFTFDAGSGAVTVLETIVDGESVYRAG